mgnify:CR=1 FL=1
MGHMAETLLAGRKSQQSSISSNANGNNHKCIGMHIWWSDKGGGVDEFLSYIERFLQLGGNCAMVATDSGKVLDHMYNQWPAHIRNVLRFQGDNIVQSNDKTPVFEMQTNKK